MTRNRIMSKDHTRSSKVSHVINMCRISYLCFICIVLVIMLFVHRCMYINVEDSWKSGNASTQGYFNLHHTNSMKSETRQKKAQKLKEEGGRTGCDSSARNFFVQQHLLKAGYFSIESSIYSSIIMHVHHSPK